MKRPVICLICKKEILLNTVNGLGSVIDHKVKTGHSRFRQVK